MYEAQYSRRSRWVLMQDIISRIRNGNFDYEKGTLDFSCTKIELTLPKETIYEGSFHIISSPGLVTDGYVTSSDMRMECLTEEFSGNNAEIAYRWNGVHSEEGDVVKGSFYICSSRGEYYLPYVISVEHAVMESSVGPIKNLFHFANLAKSSWDEAVKLFYSDSFKDILTGNDAIYLDSYRALSAVLGNAQNMEEFLIHINKKQRTDYFLSTNRIEITKHTRDSIDDVTETGIEITRNGWGYTALNIECEGDFVFTRKEFISEDDFIGNTYRLPVFIDTNSCHNGLNYGKIYIFNSYVSYEAEVEVRIGHARTGKGQSRKKIIAQLMQSYVDFRLKKLPANMWLKETGRLAERLAVFDEDDIEARLFQAQVLITEERYNEAGWILDHVAELIDSAQKKGAKDEKLDAMLAYYWYLITLINTDEETVREAAERVRQLYRRDRRNWRVAWLLLYLSREYAEKPASKWELLEQLFEEGATSPIIYLEALTLINNNPPLVRKLGDFELQVINMGVKHDALSAQMKEQLISLCGRKKEYSPILLGILKSIYEKDSDVRILQEICTLLIKGGKTGRDAAEWYCAGVRAQLRITNIYEYYMASVDMDCKEDIPDTVLMYFSYQNNLDWEHSAYLYHYILDNREKFPELYASYRGKIESFAIDRIQKTQINRHLAAIYSEVLTEGLINAQTADALSRLLFAHRIEISDARIRKAYIYHPESLEVEEYTTGDNNGWISIYGSDYTIALEDAYGNRFTDSVDYVLEKLMQPGRFTARLGAFAEDNVNFNLYLAKNAENMETLDADTAERCLDLILSGRISDRLKVRLTLRLLQYYYDNDDTRAIDICIETISSEKLSADERGRVLKYITALGKYDTAYEWLKEYSPYFVAPKVLLRLLEELINSSEEREDKVITAAACYVFSKGKYNSCILRYLVRYYRGMSKNMRDIWKTANSFDVDSYELCERILVQMIYTGAFVGEKYELFKDYISQGGAEDVEKAFLASCSHDYFVRERVIDGSVFDEICTLYRRGEEVQKVCMLAFLKYYAENAGERTERVMEAAGAFLKALLSEKIHLNMFREYDEYRDLLRDMEDKTIIEYRAHPAARARIHYVIMRENGDAGEYYSEYMREAYSGVYFKEFILFFGEQLQYYIMEETDGREELTESGTLQKNDFSDSAQESRFELINDMVISKSMQDYDTLDRLMEEYFKREYFNGELFKLE
jgi:hypothetical protein